MAHLDVPARSLKDLVHRIKDNARGGSCFSALVGDHPSMALEPPSMRGLHDLTRRVVPRAARRRVRRTWEVVSHVGRAVECPLCRHTARSWLESPQRPWASRCPWCDSFPRHRALWLWLDRLGLRFEPGMRVLHVAPETVIRQKLKAVPGLTLTTIDLFRGDVGVRGDITRLPFPDAAFDVVLCNHVLEHVPDDRAAMVELSRVTADSGWATLLVPIDLRRDTTYEDPTITAPEARTAAFGQSDHVRQYGRDYADLLQNRRWDVTTAACRDVFDTDERRRSGLYDEEVLFLATPRRSAPQATPDEACAPLTTD